eukprot:scaffold107276_cov79-Phaeocystis_antarctica.AAC.3
MASAIAPSEVPDDVFLRSELRLGELQTVVLTWVRSCIVLARSLRRAFRVLWFGYHHRISRETPDVLCYRLGLGKQPPKAAGRLSLASLSPNEYNCTTSIATDPLTGSEHTQ